MKYIVFVLALLLTACASTTVTPPLKDFPKDSKDGYARVLGTGKTFEEAKLNGFQLAVELAVGSVVVTEKKATNNLIVRDQILKHSSGYIDDFKIIDQSVTSTGYLITMDIKVKSSRIAEVILNTGEKQIGVFDSPLIMDQYNSYINERKDAERLIDNLLNVYPKNSFIITKSPSKIGVNIDRDMVLSMPYTIKWSDAWIESFLETVGRVSDPNKSETQTISVIHKKLKPGIIYDYEQLELHIADYKIYKKVNDTISSKIYIVITLEDINNRVLHVVCNHNFPMFDAIPGNVPWYKGTAEITINKGSDLFNNFKKVDHVSVTPSVNYKMCDNNYYGIK